VLLQERSMKICKKCGGTERYKHRHCKTCHKASAALRRATNKNARSAYMKQYNEANRDSIKNTKFKRKYGITLTEYQLLLTQQGNRCYICWATDRDLQVDHCHKTGKVRKLLCGQCNKAIGLFQDQAHLLSRAAMYLETH